MIVLDTDVLSELVRGPRADPAVLSFLRGLREQPVTTVLNRAELLAGVAMLPGGARRARLAVTIEEVLSDLEICLPFTADCPAAYAEVVAVRARLGRPVATMDALIGAVALVNGAAVATRNVSGFADLGLRVLDPWTATP